MRRVHLEAGAWLDVARGWLAGHAPLMEQLVRDVRWRSEERTMYQRRVAVPRLFAALRKGDGPEVIEAMRRALDAHYQTAFERVTVALYRNGNDSVTWHGDYVARRMLPDTLVATVSVGAPRKFFLRRKSDPLSGDALARRLANPSAAPAAPAGRQRSISMSLGWGDLVVMGGSCQRTYEHAIPKVAQADPRIAIMFRPVWEAPEDAPLPSDREQ